MNFEELLAELGIKQDDLSVNIKRRISNYKKLQEEVEAARLKKTEGTLTKSGAAELEEAEIALEAENDALIAAIRKWEKNKDVNAERAARLAKSREAKKSGGGSGTEFVINDDVKAKLNQLNYSPEDIAAMSADQAKQIIEGNVAKQVNPPNPPAPPAVKKTGSGLGALGVVVAFGLAAFFGIKWFNKNH